MAIHITNPSEQIRLPGQYSLTTVLLSSPLNSTELSITPLLIGIDLYESLFQNALSGSLSLRDTANIISTFPICGYETLTFEFSCETADGMDWFSVSFRVYAIKNIIEMTGGGKTYSLEFISEEYIANKEIAISRAFNSMTTSDIAKTIWEDSLITEKSIRIEETSGLIDMICPYWSPMKLMDWLCSRSVSTDRDGANYIFFETLDGFNFVSLETLVADIDDEKIDTFYYGAKDIRDDDSPTPESAYTVSEIQIDSSFDLIQNLSSGMYSNTMIEHDIVRKTINVHKFDYEKSFDKYEHLEDWSFLHEKVDKFKEVYDSKRFLIPQHYQLFGEYTVSSRDTSKRERTLQTRVSQLQQINTYKITLTLPGNINTRAGDVVYLFYPSKGADDVEDPLMSGHYLVLSVKNSMSVVRHDTVIEIAKDSYFREIPSQGV